MTALGPRPNGPVAPTPLRLKARARRSLVHHPRGRQLNLHENFEFRFDFYFIHKPSFALVTFFNAVFDAGLNDAMKWDWYWTPLRFPLIAELSRILDDGILQESWRLCLVP